MIWDYTYPDDDDDRISCLEAAGRVDALCEYADRCLLGQVVQDGDPPDGVVVEVRLSYALEHQWYQLPMAIRTIRAVVSQ